MLKNININFMIFIFFICYCILTISNIPNIKDRLSTDVFVTLLIGINLILFLNYKLYRNNINVSNIICILILSFVFVDLYETLLYYKPPKDNFIGGQGKKYEELISKVVKNEYIENVY
jgi:L-cystine uptake protein TcyP (sodium:dicarboxylate symporter family)